MWSLSTTSQSGCVGYHSVAFLSLCIHHVNGYTAARAGETIKGRGIQSMSVSWFTGGAQKSPLHSLPSCHDQQDTEPSPSLAALIVLVLG